MSINEDFEYKLPDLEEEVSIRDDEDSCDYITREEELTNVLMTILDLYDQDLLVESKLATPDDRDIIDTTMNLVYNLLHEGEL